MGFPLGVTGSVPLGEVDPATVLERFAGVLGAGRLRVLEQNELGVRFRKPFVQLTPLPLGMRMLDAGRVWVDGTVAGPVLRYEAAVTRTLVVYLAGLVFTVVVVALWLPAGPVRQGLMTVVVVFMLLILAVNYAITAFGFPSFLRRLIRQG